MGMYYSSHFSLTIGLESQKIGTQLWTQIRNQVVVCVLARSCGLPSHISWLEHVE